MGLINRLDPLVSSQIAAGEVIERPASAVKELVENSIDALSTRITVDFEDGGLSLIRVSDNGTGMSPEDAPLSLERFATSKLSAADDLSRISSLGFRGEALPSIAACSRLNLETRAEAFESGTEIRVDGGTITSITEKGLPHGTTVTVRDLFYNTPARLRFVKSHSSERQAIIDVVMRLALARHNVAFTLRTGGKTVFATTGQGLANALMDLFGPEDASAMVEVRHEAGDISVVGFAGLPSLYRRQRDRQMFSVRGRPVRDTSLAWALDSAYSGYIPPKTYPVAILDILLPPEEVDVNVHPTKSQVKFRDEAAVKRALARGVGEALSKAGLRAPQERQGSRMTVLPPREGWGIVRDSGSPAKRRPQAWPSSYSTLHFGADGRHVPPAQGTEREESLLLPGTAGADAPVPEWQYLGSVADTYLIASSGSSLLIVDKHALMESLTYRAMLQGESGSQDLLMAEMIRLDPKELAVYEDCEEVVAGLGFGCRLVGDRTVLVTSVPMVMGKALPPGSLKEILSRLQPDLGQGEQGRRSRESSPPASLERLLDSARMETAACHASVRAREPLTKEEACSLLGSLFRHPEARTCPHGRPVIRELTIREMGEFFGRTSHAG